MRVNFLFALLAITVLLRVIVEIFIAPLFA